MAKQFTLVYDNKKLKTEYKRFYSQQKFYDAILTYNRLKVDMDPEINLLQAALYESVDEIGFEIEHLLKVFINEKYTDYNQQMVAYRIALFFYCFSGIDRFDEYLKILKARNPKNKKLSKVDFKIFNSQTKLHFYNQTAFEEFGEAIKKVSIGEFGSIQELEKVDKSYSDYARIQNLLCVFYLKNNQPQKAVRVIEGLAKDGLVDETWVQTAFIIAEGAPEYKNEISKLLDGQTVGQFGYESLLAKALIEMNNENFSESIKILKGLKSPKCYKSDVLKFLILCYDGLGDKENVVKYAKVLYAFNPRNVWLRLLIEQAEHTEFVDAGRCVRSRPDKLMVANLKKLLKRQLKAQENFEQKSDEEIEFIIYALQEVKNYALYKKTIKKLLHSNRKNFIQDILISVYTRSEFSQLATQVLIEEKSTDLWWVLVDGALLKLKFNLPECLRRESINKDKQEYLLTVYAQTLSLLLYTGSDIKDLEKRLNEPMQLLLDNPIEENDLLLDSDNVIYILARIMDEQNEIIEDSFEKISSDTKKKLSEILIKEGSGFKLRY